MWTHTPDSENYHYSVVAAAVCLQPNTYCTGELFAMSSTRPIQWKYSKPESETGCLTMRQYGITSEHSTVSLGVDTWTYLPQGFRVSPLAQPENEKPTATCATGGRQPYALLERYNQDIVYWKTFQGCFLLEEPTTGPTLAEYSQTWQKAGLMQNGECFRQPKQVQRIKEIGCGLWPTPRSAQGMNDSTESVMKRLEKVGYEARLEQAVRLWPTPARRDYKGANSLEHMQRGQGHLNQLANRVAYDKENQVRRKGQLNPRWVEWLMGWPIGWTSLDKLNPADFQHWLEATLARTWWAIDPADLGEPEKYPTPKALGGVSRKPGTGGKCLQEEARKASQKPTTGPIPRLTTTKKNRTNRLKALGNGQVSICAAVVWRLLTRDFEI